MQSKLMMTVGELAEKMGTTVRTLQFYQKCIQIDHGITADIFAIPHAIWYYVPS